MRHLYSCRSYTYVRLCAIKLFMCVYRHFVARPAELPNQSRLSVPRKCWGECLYTILKRMMMSTLDSSNWLVFLFLPWDLRVPCRCILPCKHQIEFPSWTRHYHETICKSDKLLGSSVISYRVHWSQSVCNHSTQLQENSTPLFRSPCSNAQFIPSPGVKAMEWKPRSLG